MNKITLWSGIRRTRSFRFNCKALGKSIKLMDVETL